MFGRYRTIACLCIPKVLECRVAGFYIQGVMQILRTWTCERPYISHTISLSFFFSVMRGAFIIHARRNADASLKAAHE